NLSVIRAFIQKGANVNAVDKSGYTPLMYACLSGQLDLVKELVALGARVSDVNAMDHNTTSLMLTFESPTFESPEDAPRIEEVALFLIENGVDVHAKSGGKTTFVKACEKGLGRVAKKLLAMNVDVGEVEGELTPFAACCAGGLEDLA